MGGRIKNLLLGGLAALVLSTPSTAFSDAYTSKQANKFLGIPDYVSRLNDPSSFSDYKCDGCTVEDYMYLDKLAKEVLKPENAVRKGDAAYSLNRDGYKFVVIHPGFDNKLSPGDIVRIYENGKQIKIYRLLFK